MFPEQIYTVDTRNASWISESGKYTGNYKILYYSTYVFMPPKQIDIHILLRCAFPFFSPLNNTLSKIRISFRLMTRAHLVSKYCFTL